MIDNGSTPKEVTWIIQDNQTITFKETLRIAARVYYGYLKLILLQSVIIIPLVFLCFHSRLFFQNLIEDFTVLSYIIMGIGLLSYVVAIIFWFKQLFFKAIIRPYKNFRVSTESKSLSWKSFWYIELIPDIPFALIPLGTFLLWGADDYMPNSLEIFSGLLQTVLPFVLHAYCFQRVIAKSTSFALQRRVEQGEA